MNISSFNQKLSRVVGGRFPPPSRYQWRRYSVAVLAVAIALLLKLLLNSVIEQESPFLVFFAAVQVSALYGGMGAGVLATFLAALVSDYFFLDPKYSFIHHDLGQNLRLFLFVAEGILISEIVALLKSTKRRAELSKQEALHHQESLRQSEERFRMLVETVKDYAIFMINPDGHIASWNVGAERIFGYQESEIVGQQFSCIFTSEDIQSGKPEQELSTAMATGRADNERWHICKNGTTFWASGVVTAIRDQAGNLQGFSKVVRDMTERKLTEDALEASEAQFRATFNSAAVGIAHVGTDGKWLQVNQKLCDIIGYTQAELLQRTFQDITHPDNLDADIEYVRRVLANEIQTYSMEKRYIHQNASQVWINLTVSLVREPSGKPKYFISVIEDITKRKQMESALRLSDERLRLALQVNQASTWDWNLVTNEFMWCHNHELLFGLTPGTFDGTYQAVLECIHPEDRQLVIQEVTRAIESRIDYDQEYRIVWSNGNIHWLAVKGKVFYDETKQAVRMVGLSVDITTLKRTADQLKASLQEKEVLLKEIHHRVKNNLQIISSLLNLQSGYIEDQKTIEILNQCENRVGAMALIHEQLYQSDDLARIEFADYVKTLTANLFSSYGIHSDAIALLVDVDNIFLSVDAAIPCGLLINELVSNSLKHAFPSGKKGEIYIGLHVAASPEATSGEHCGDFANDNNHLTLSVSDDGIGFPENLDFKNTESLGLQIVIALTNQLEGTIKLNRNNGTKFEVKFY